MIRIRGCGWRSWWLGAALAAKDAAALRATFGDEVDFRAMTPNHTWEARTPTAVIDDVILGTCGVPEVCPACELQRCTRVSSVWCPALTNSPSSRLR